MNYWESRFIEWHKAPPAGWDIYLCQIRTGRNKAIVTAVVELCSLLAEFEPAALLSGPRAGEKGVFWVAVGPEYRDSVRDRLLYLGYTNRVERVIPQERYVADDDAAELEPVKWRKAWYVLLPVYVEDPAWLRQRAPDQRLFLLKNREGELEPVKGYRGDGHALSRRGLPPEDARALVNLAAPDQRNLIFLDPFAGVGGLIIEALDRGFGVYSGDLDTKVRYGLQALSKRHYVADAAELPFADRTFSAVASELPFHVVNADLLNRFMEAFARVLKPGGRVSLMLVEVQLGVMERRAERLGFRLILKEAINRKGTAVWIAVWEK